MNTQNKTVAAVSPKRSKWARRIAMVGGAIALGLTLVVLLFDWNLLKGPISNRVSAATGRQFAINGDLRVNWSLKPHIRADGLTLANAPWSTEPTMGKIERLDFRIDLWQLLKGNIVFPEVFISSPQVFLEKDPAGKANWDFGDKKAKGDSNVPTIGLLRIENGKINYRDAAANTDLKIGLSMSPTTSPDATRKVELSSGSGSLSGRALSIRRVEAEVSRTPHIRAEGLVLSNAEWSRDARMAEIEVIELRFDIDKISKERIELAELKLSQPRIVLEKNAKGVANWTLGQDADAKSPKPSPELEVGTFQMNEGKLVYRDATTQTDVQLAIATDAPKSGEAEQMTQVSGGGKYKGMQFNLRARSGSVLSLRDTKNPYPIRVNANIGRTKAFVQGVLMDPFKLRGLNLNLDLQGQDLSQLYPILGVPVPQTRPYRLSGHLLHEGETWTFRRFKGAVGGSDLSGDFTVDRGQEPQFIRADLTSKVLDFKDLAGFIGAHPDSLQSPKQRSKGRVLPDEPISLEKIRAANTDIRFRGKHIATQKLPLEDMNAHLIIRDGKVHLDPLNFGVAGGQIISKVGLDTSGGTTSTVTDVTVRRLRLNKLFPGFELTKGSIGDVDGRAKLAMKGNSVAKMLGSSDGALMVVTSGGAISDLLVRLTNLDVANAVGLWLSGDKNVPIRCMVASFGISDGNMRTDTMVLDTEPEHITGQGNINLKTEVLDLQLVARARDRSLVAFRGPILIEGTFGSPVVRPDLKGVITRGGLAIGLGILGGPPGALLPLVEFGSGEEINCPAVIASAENNFARQSSKAARYLTAFKQRGAARSVE
jgi:uncharacterized protein involved in outer membrane biogenesis